MPPYSVLPGNVGVQNNNNNNNPAVRFYELLDALKMEYDLVLQCSSAGGIDTTHKMSQSEYESKGKNF